MSSLREQVNLLFRRHRAMGESRAAWRAANPGFGLMADRTFSWNTELRYKSTCHQFVAFCKTRYGIRQIRDIQSGMTVTYIAERAAVGRSPRTLATDVTALRKLSYYAQLDHWIKTSFVPDELSVPHGAAPRYSYPLDRVPEIIAWVARHDPLAGIVLEWQWTFGLRLDETIRVRPDKIDRSRGTLEVKGKGGKRRVLAVTDWTLIDQLDQSRRFPLLKGLAAAWARKIEGWVREACLELGLEPKGTHALRAGAAQRKYDELCERGYTDREARKEVSRLLGHNRISVTNSYAP